jgi:hypothetical protein
MDCSSQAEVLSIGAIRTVRWLCPYLSNVNFEMCSFNKVVTICLQMDAIKTKNGYIDIEKRELHVFQVS